MIENRPRIALIIDRKNWAFDNISKYIVKNCSHKFDFRIIILAELRNVNQLFLMISDCSLVHFMWRGALSELKTQYSKNLIASLGINYNYFLKQFKHIPMTFSVYDHMYLTKEEIYEKVNLFNKFAVSYVVSSDKLFDIYTKIDLYKKPWGVIPDGVDLLKYRSFNLKRFEFNKIKNRPLTIGWVGNSAWGDGKDDVKGVNTILNVAIDELQNEGYNIKKYYADKQTNYIPSYKMPEYYSEIDIYVCTSLHEGTPNPILESMASGVPIISTDVGIVSAALGTKQKEFILKDRTVDELKEKIKYLYCNRNLFKELSEENLIRVKTWDWIIICEKFEEFFTEMIEHKNSVSE